MHETTTTRKYTGRQNHKLRPKWSNHKPGLSKNALREGIIGIGRSIGDVLINTRAKGKTPG